MNRTKQTNIIASMRDQLLDLHLGILTKAEWDDRYDKAAALGVTFPERLQNVRGA